MPFSFRLSGTRIGPSRSVVDPWTSKPTASASFRMGDEERAAVVAVIARLGGSVDALLLGPTKMTFRDFDGPRFGVSVTGPIAPAMKVLFEIATAGRLVVMNDHEKCDEPIPVVTTAEATEQATASNVDLGPPELATEADQFLRVLLPGYDAS